MKCKCGVEYTKTVQYQDCCDDCCEKDIEEAYRDWHFPFEQYENRGDINKNYLETIQNDKAKAKRHKLKNKKCFICGTRLTDDSSQKLCDICSPYWMTNRKLHNKDERIEQTIKDVEQFGTDMERLDHELEEGMYDKI